MRLVKYTNFQTAINREYEWIGFPCDPISHQTWFKLPWYVSIRKHFSMAISNSRKSSRCYYWPLYRLYWGSSGTVGTNADDNVILEHLFNSNLHTTHSAEGRYAARLSGFWRLPNMHSNFYFGRVIIMPMALATYIEISFFIKSAYHFIVRLLWNGFEIWMWFFFKDMSVMLF